MVESSNTSVADGMPSLNQGDVQVYDMLLGMVRSLVNDVDKVELIWIAAGEGAAFQVRVTANDLGKVIGRGGRTARAIRCILSSVAMKNGRRYSLDIAQVVGQN